VVVKNAKLKHQDVELAISAESICLQDITESIIDNHTRTCCEFKSKAPVVFCKIDHKNIRAQMGQGDRNASMRALHIADALARNLPKIWQESPENLPRFSNNSPRLGLRATKRR